MIIRGIFLLPFFFFFFRKMIGYSHRFEMVNGWSCSFSISIHKLHEQLCTKRQLEFGFAKWILKGLSTRVWSVHGCQQFRGLGRGKEYSDGFSMPTPCHFQRKHRDLDDIKGLRLFSDTIVIVFNDQQDWWLPFGFMKYKRAFHKFHLWSRTASCSHARTSCSKIWLRRLNFDFCCFKIKKEN